MKQQKHIRPAHPQVLDIFLNPNNLFFFFFK